MVASTFSAAFDGVEARLIEVQCAIAPGLPAFHIVGLPDKSVSEARDRIRASFAQIHLALPNRKITVNLAPADLPKSGAQFDLPIAIAIMAALDAVPADKARGLLSLGELGLDGKLLAPAGVLPAALLASAEDKLLLCPKAASAEAAWAGEGQAFGAGTLLEVLHHLTGHAPLPCAQATAPRMPERALCMSQVRGQERSKRVLEIAAAGHHNMIMVGPPGSGKTMLAERVPTILPPLAPREVLGTSVLHSLAGQLPPSGILKHRPFSAPHHSATQAALCGGGRNAGPGEISLAHNGVLFLDELPEFRRDALEALRQPLESHSVTIARAQHKQTYPARFMLIAAANPCHCGHLADAGRACAQAPICGQKYMSKISGPLWDRIDLRVEVPPVGFQELDTAPKGETSAQIAARVTSARAVQAARYATEPDVTTNGDAPGDLMARYAAPTPEGRALLEQVDARFGLSARAYHRLLRVARTIADLEGVQQVERAHLAEAVAYRILTSEALPVG